MKLFIIFLYPATICVNSGGDDGSRRHLGITFFKIVQTPCKRCNQCVDECGDYSES